ncbi:60S ribosomal protein L6 [Nosema granulosis]|uniref:60S ribosomal protein L6 n=1 Tax=Nosema granulosis TaxID=83296 RepID=A0A9P6KYH2_9MICR|nr:60S ribosomal protein L6 [Nosema granulosis]
MPKYIEKYMKKLAKKNERQRRTDLTLGSIVVVLEGEFEGKRVVFLKSLENNLALCTGPSKINGVPFFKIDERYLLATSTKIEYNGVIDVDESMVLLSERDVKVERMEVEGDDKMNMIDSTIEKAIEKVDFLKAYLSEEFEVDSTRDFYSQKY